MAITHPEPLSAPTPHKDSFTIFHAAQTSGTDWQTIGQKLRERLPQPCRGGIGLLWGTPSLHDDLPSLALMLRSITKVPLWSSATVDGIMGIAPGHRGAAVLILPFGPPEAVPDGPGADPGVMLLQHAGIYNKTTMQQLMTAQDFILGAQFAAPGYTPGTSQIYFSPAVTIVSGVTQSCLPVGPTHSITRAHGRQVISIDNMPAQQILRREIGANMLQNPADWRDRIFIGLPEQGHDRSDYRTIAIAELEPDGSIILTDPIDTGRRILVTARGGAGATHDLRQMLHATLHRCPTPRAALYFTTLWRQELFLDEGGERAHLQAALDPKTPFIGLDSAAILSGRRAHHDAGLLVLFG